MTRTSWNWARNFLHRGVGFAAVNSFLPYLSSRARASPSLKPSRASVPKALSISIDTVLIFTYRILRLLL